MQEVTLPLHPQAAIPPPVCLVAGKASPPSERQACGGLAPGHSYSGKSACEEKSSETANSERIRTRIFSLLTLQIYQGARKLRGNRVTEVVMTLTSHDSPLHHSRLTIQQVTTNLSEMT
jgi:hypothetical protein